MSEDMLPFDKRLTRPWVCPKEDTACTRTKPCRSCLGRRNRRKGQRAQRDFQKRAGLVRQQFRGADGNEEQWRDFFRWEHKSAGIARPVLTRFLAAEAQSEAARPIGDLRPFAAGFSQGGRSVVVVDADTWSRVIVPLLYGLEEA
jgi:hypothetical protein